MGPVAVRHGFERLSPLEVATSIVTGRLPSASRPKRSVVGQPPERLASPVAALESAILPALVNAPCVVLFSGGLDSSIVLATAMRLARREGLPEPIAMTNVYPGAAESEEGAWQYAAIERIGVSEWIRHTWPADHDLLGDIAVDGLRRRGLIWPPLLQMGVAPYERAPGGSLLNGEGGDEVLGPKRITTAVRMVKRRDFRQRAALSSSAKSLAPWPARRALLRREFRRQVPAPWVRREAREAVIAALCQDAVDEPLHWGAATRHLIGRRAPVVVQQAYERIMAERGVQLVQPLLDEHFINSLAEFGQPWGFLSRNDLARRLFGDVLPSEILNRTSKARFNSAFFGPNCREFVASWNGNGIDTDIVDVDRLRDEWLTDRPSGLTYTLLHAAWLHSQQLSPETVR